MLVDGAIVEVENAYNKLHLWQAEGRQGDFHEVRLEALKEVGPSVFFSLLVIAVAFLPVFALVDQEGRLFKPLAYSKNLAMAIAALLAITLDPAMRMLFTRMDPFTFRPRWLALAGDQGCWSARTTPRSVTRSAAPSSRVYDPACRFVLRLPQTVIAAGRRRGRRHRAGLLSGSGSEFMPPLNEGSILYMPTTLPGISVAQAEELLQTQDRVLAVVPRGRAGDRQGRARRDVDRPGAVLDDGDDGRPEARVRVAARRALVFERAAAGVGQGLVREPSGPTASPGTSWSTRWTGRFRFPGRRNAWTMPIKARIDMLSTGVRTPVGIKVFGADLAKIERIGEEIEGLLRPLPGTRSVFAERVTGGYFVDFTPRRDQLARYGLTIEQVQMVIMTRDRRRERHHDDRGAGALPGQRALPARAARRHRAAAAGARPGAGRGADPARASWPTSSSCDGPSMIRNENGFMAGYVYVDITGRDIGGYVEEAKRVVARAGCSCRQATSCSGAGSTRT